MLVLKFTDENGEERCIQPDRDVFTVGRHSTCDLTYTDSRLSREHLRLEREGGKFLASDPGSSNGTTINGNKLNSPVELKNGDILNLGGGLEIKVEITADEAEAIPDSPAIANSDLPVETAATLPANSPQPAPTSASAQPDGGIPTAFFIIAPLLAVFVLAIVIVAFVFLGRGGNEVANNRDDIGQTSDVDDNDPDKPADDNDEPTPKPTKSSTPLPSNGEPTPSPQSRGTEQPPSNLGDTAKVEQNSA
ncbi:MAG: FHA domain-containing protein, partial [Acidobacteria bacterium]|nr:FHA domain-containing protein [Acidobacteriota bacterium]